ncbi:carbohydrate kinase family protein [Parafilimonas sp.]|uniref:carbohydrate kinase family protein n=1 Tax=Parafilimonas sp. TaxID=1969739 RepID=UPI0039E6D66D
MTTNKPYYPVICFGEVLWDMLPAGKQPGGAPMNVAYHLCKLGKNTAVISRIGCDEPGNELLDVWKSRSINTSFFQLDKNISTGKVYARAGNDHEMHYDVVKPAAWDCIQWKEEYNCLVSQAEYFVFGSLAARSSESKAALFKCMEAAQTKVLDINLRAPHFNRENVETLLSKANILKLNQAELQLVAGWYGHFESDEERVGWLSQRFGHNMVIVTKGGNGAMLLAGGRFYHHPGFPVTVADTIGSGDAFLAGFLAGLLDHKSYDDMLLQASAMGAFIASKTGACPQYSLADISGFCCLKSNQASIFQSI